MLTDGAFHGKKLEHFWFSVPHWKLKVKHIVLFHKLWLVIPCGLVAFLYWSTHLKHKCLKDMTYSKMGHIYF